MLKTVAVIVFVVLVLMVVFAVLSRNGMNPLDRLSTPPASSPTSVTPSQPTA